MKQPPRTLAYNRALVTGGTSGLGKTFVHALLGEGVPVVTTSRTPSKVKDASPCPVIQLDLGAPEKALAEIRSCLDTYPDIDLLINNAGSAIFGRTDLLNTVEIETQLSILLHSPILIAREFYAQMRARKRGTIVNVSSLAGTYPMPFMALYNTGKAGLSAYSQSLILENSLPDVHIIDMQCGDFRTNFNNSMLAQSPTFETDQTLKAAWGEIESHLQKGAAPELAAQALLKRLKSPRSGKMVVGDWFQAGIGPWLARIVPHSLILRFLKFYYKI